MSHSNLQQKIPPQGDKAFRKLTKFEYDDWFCHSANPEKIKSTGHINYQAPRPSSSSVIPKQPCSKENWDCGTANGAYHTKCFQTSYVSEAALAGYLKAFM